ncbi:piwi-like protein 3 [Rousettus aegyptiacus]|uniref:piwi-like protein 3 n=1 Tax=Rousettus aegyptiacus TaxID=9407 RepID=UPI00168D1065|nr:piwi-like protein 3 [Rousettus aegyptiacus]
MSHPLMWGREAEHIIYSVSAKCQTRGSGRRWWHTVFSSLKQKTELVSHFKDHLVKVTIEFSSELTPTSPDHLRYYNILFRKILKIVKLRQVGHNYYNKEETEEIHQHKFV